MSVGSGFRGLKIHVVEAGKWHRVGELESLSGGDAQNARKLDGVLIDPVLVGHSGLLVLLVLNLRAQHVELDADAGIMAGRSLVQQRFGRKNLPLRIGQIGAVGEDLQIQGSNVQDDIAAIVQQGEIDDRSLVPRATVELIISEIEERLVEVDRGLRGVHFYDGAERISGRQQAGAGKARQQGRLETHRRQINL
jgi:hypothetical protein